MLVATLFLLALGFGAAVLLAVASKVFYVWEDPKLIEVEDALLGANCGGCGYPGCSAAASAVVAGDAGADICVAGGAGIAAKVAAVLGVKIEVKEPETACTSCTYGNERAASRFVYVGVNDCRAALLYGKGSKECPVGCMGLGSCVRACPFGALSMGSDELPVVDQDRCRACGICVETCPKGIMELTSTSRRMLGDYRVNECTAPCQQGCPTGIDIPAYIREIGAGNYREAIRIIKERNPLPLVCGRICPAPCETDCRRTLADEAVAINHLKRFAADFEMKSGERVFPYLNPPTGHRVAVVGGGAQGLTTSYYLACMGHKPTIFEATSKLGGIIRSVIARSRLPEDVVDWEVEGILAAGVEARTGTVIGKDYTIASLLDEGYEAVALAIGGIDGRKVQGGNVDRDRTIPGVHLLLDFLVASSRGEVPELGHRVYVVGGGNSTLAAAQFALGSGATEVTIVYPYPRDELLARRIDITEAQSQGIRFLFSTVVNQIGGEKDSLTTLRLKGVGDSVADVPADALIVATGRLSDLVFARPVTADEEQSHRWTTAGVHRMQPDNRSDDIFNLMESGVVNDSVAVVRSIGRGRRVARAVHLFVSGKELAPQEDVLGTGAPVVSIDCVKGVEGKPRNMMPVDEAAAPLGSVDSMYELTEAVLGYPDAVARKEADRCLQCGLICYKNDENLGAQASRLHDQ